MDPINFFSLASQQNRWLSVRQSVVAQNVANVNTPGYKALDVEPFEAVLNATGVEMRKTQTRHLSPVSGAGSDEQTEENGKWQLVHSGNSVGLEEQMLKSSEVAGAYARNTGVMKTFHRMLLASSRG
ncbi:flagellar basal body rod protein FlgB [Hyphomicrobium sp. CS1GBMeth3]|uniref:flagellar basal body rod protein FlgB n=1 Tax=Hyphomicrobium sp. CS1GBMeth3 TaxID=1892845 RepID=UPI0009303049|nr:flagellar basal body rod protein FlgB [Hyphomicrobium sp. CS1GBMeth3]